MSRFATGVSQCSLCPSFGCDVPVSDSVVMELVEEENVIDRYKQLMCNSFIASNKDMRWCPSPTCGKVIKVNLNLHQVNLKIRS